ncbi:MAG: hypothetical protein KTR31_27715 [Myxococcales bacterium]|nr:hypothetical protein [Myxococcales bacterium]
MLWWMAVAMAWEERGMDGEPTGRTLDPAQTFLPTVPSWFDRRGCTTPLDLGLVASGTADTIRRLRSTGDPMAQPAMLGQLGVSMDDVLRTLDFVAQVAVEDRGQEYQRLNDPRWVAGAFEAWRWLPDAEGASARKIEVPEDQLRITKYVVYTVDGSPVRTDRFGTALYRVPKDEVPDGEPGVRAALTRMDVYAGAFESGGAHEGLAEPLVWLTRDGSNQALLQGTIHVTLPNGTPQLFNVHKNNGMAWDPSIRNLDQQPRFWYFRHVRDILGVEDTRLRPEVAVAGDVYNVGLGKLLALEWQGPHGPELRLAVMADTGGAFQPNLFQLDYFAGTFADRAAYDAWAKDMPTRAPVTILVRRP